MQKFDVMIALEGVREAKGAWAKAVTKFNADIEYIMARLLHEAARNFMSPEEVATASGFTVKRIRVLMRAAGLDPKRGKTLLSKLAAEALAENAALMGIAPHEMDLMSPLAYLPMGDKMRRELQAQSVSQVTELPEDVVDEAGDAEALHDFGHVVSGNDDFEGTALHDGEVVSGYTSISEAVHDLHLRGGRLRYTCPVCGA